MVQTHLTCALKTEYQETHTEVDSKPQKNNYDIEPPTSGYCSATINSAVSISKVSSRE